MTTIATDGKSMAGDGQRDHRGTVTNLNAEKIRRLPDGRLVGTSGDVAFGEMFVEWLENGGDRPEYKGDGGFTALILMPCGELMLAGQDCHPCTINAPYAIGSGMDLAIGAMAAGASPAEAVEIAAAFDPHTGGVIASFDRTILQTERWAA